MTSLSSFLKMVPESLSTLIHITIIATCAEYVMISLANSNHLPKTPDTFSWKVALTKKLTFMTNNFLGLITDPIVQLTLKPHYHFFVNWPKRPFWSCTLDMRWILTCLDIVHKNSMKKEEIESILLLRINDIMFCWIWNIHFQFKYYLLLRKKYLDISIKAGFADARQR